MSIKIKFFIGINYKKITESLSFIRGKSCFAILNYLSTSKKLINRKLFNLLSNKLNYLLKLNCNNNNNMLRNFYISQCRVNKYKFLKRTKIRARGKIYSIQKKSSIVSLMIEKIIKNEDTLLRSKNHLITRVY